MSYITLSICIGEITYSYKVLDIPNNSLLIKWRIRTYSAICIKFLRFSDLYFDNTFTTEYEFKGFYFI